MAQGWYVPSSVVRVPEQRVFEQVVRLPEGGAVTGWAALRLWQGAYFDGIGPDGLTERPVPLALGPGVGLRPDPQVRLLSERLDLGEIVVRFGVPCTRPVRALFDEMRAVDLTGAVVAFDMAAAAGLVSVARLSAYLRSRRRWRGVRGVRRAMGLVDEHSRSPAETRLRLFWVQEAGWPRPLVNQPMWDDQGRLLGVADLLDPACGLVAEYDGADHRAPARQSRDEDRTGRMRDAGLEVFRVTAPDLLDRPRLLARMEAARARALRTRAARGWTLVAPPGWEPDLPLDAWIDLEEMRRAQATG